MGIYDELNAEHRRIEEQRQKERAEKAHQQEIDAAKRPENAAKMPLMGTYADLNETHRRIAAERQDEHSTAQPGEPQAHAAPPEPERPSAPSPAPMNNYHKGLDAEQARRLAWADAFEKGDEEKQAELRDQAIEKGYDWIADQNAAQFMLQQRQSKQQHEAQQAGNENDAPAEQSAKENAESSPRETTDKALEKSERAQIITDWLKNRSVTERTREKEHGQEM